jgi:hypothetical protein
LTLWLLKAGDDDLLARLETAKQDLTIATEAKIRIEARMKRATDVSPAKLVAFEDSLSEALRGGEVPFRKAYLKTLIDWIDVTMHGPAFRPSDLLSKTRLTALTKSREKCSFLLKTGAPDRIRTCDLCLRRAALYPAELRVHDMLHS